MFEYVWVRDGVVTHIVPQTAPIWVKIVNSETLNMLQGELYGVSDNSIKNFTAWCKLLVDHDVQWDRDSGTLVIQQWLWQAMPSYISLVILIFYEA